MKKPIKSGLNVATLSGRILNSLNSLFRVFDTVLTVSLKAISKKSLIHKSSIFLIAFFMAISEKTNKVADEFDNYIQEDLKLDITAKTWDKPLLQDNNVTHELNHEL